MNDIIWRVVKRAQIPAVKESAGLLRSDGKRTDAATPNILGQRKIYGVGHHCADTFDESHLSSTAPKQTAAAKQ